MGSKDKLFTKDFTLVLVGQIISLFANSILGFAVLLYLLNRTGSAVRYGSISAASIIPVLILPPWVLFCYIHGCLVTLIL